MIIKKIAFAFGLFALTAVNAIAQLSILVSDATGNIGDEVEVGVKVINFDQIASMQFSVNWDSSALEFKAIQQLTDSLPDFTNNQVGLLETKSGLLRIAWLDNTLNGVSLPDSALLFSLKYKIIGEQGSVSPIRITGSPTSIEFTNPDGVFIDVESLEGKITIPGTTTSLKYLEAQNGMQLYQNEPNPFKSSTTIKVLSSDVGLLQFLVTDISGKIIHQESFRSVQKERIIEIGRNILKTPGTYYYTLQSEQYRLTKKMILLP
jgi:hypothetical protein